MNLKIKIYLLLLFYLAIAEGAFIEIPTSQTVSVGEVAEFRCIHATADTIRWRVNGTLVSISRHPVDITPGSVIEGDVFVSILTITGRPEFNRTEVICVARFDDGSPDETTNPEAMLIVSMNVTDDGMSQSGFVEEPLSLNVTIGEEALFRCEHRSADAIFWRINGTSLSSLPDLNDDFIIEIIGRFHTLTVTALLEYNTTVVQCVALFHSGNSQPETTAPAVLQIQGAINRVTTLVRNFFTLSWNEPFSLDLTNVEPDIVYCVDVYNITCGGRELLISDCDVTETSYTFDVIAPDGYICEYIVTPRSNVEGAINGTPSQPLRDTLPTFTGSSTRLSIAKFGQDSNIRAYQIELTYTPDKPIPSSYSFSLQSLDGLEDMDHVETTATIEPSVLTLEVVSGLPFRRLWNCTVLAYGCQENSILNYTLSTHDFRDILSSSVHPGEVRVTGSFTDDSTATGVLVIVIGDSEVIYHKASRDGTNKIKETLITGLAGGEYSISVFVVEENGLPFERVATSPKLVAVETNDVVTPPSSSIEYSLQSTSTGVCITCTFLDSSATDCVAVVHQRISQLSSSGLMNIESSRIFPRSGDTASGCIDGVNMEDYRVGVVGGRQASITSQTGSTAIYWIIIGIVFAAIFIAVSIIAVVFVIIRIRKTQNMKENIEVSKLTDVDIEIGERRVTNQYTPYPPTPDKPKETTPLINPTGGDHSCIQQPGEQLQPHHDSGQLDETTSPLSHHGAPVPSTVHTTEGCDSVAEEPISTDEMNSEKDIPNDESVAIVHSEPQPRDGPLPAPDKTDSMADLSLLDNEKVITSTPRSGINPVRDKEVMGTPIPYHISDQNDESEETSTKHVLQTRVAPPPASVSYNTLLPYLLPVAPKWRELGVASSLNEHQLNGISTKIGPDDKKCLIELINSYIVKSDCSWEKIVAVLKMIKENAMAEELYDRHIRPYSSEFQEVHDEIVNNMDTEMKKTPDEAAPIQAEENSMYDKGIIVQGTSKLQVTGFHRRSRSTTYIHASENSEGNPKEAEKGVEGISTAPDTLRETKDEISNASDSGFVSMDVSRQDEGDTSTSVEAESIPQGDILSSNDGQKMKVKQGAQLVCPTSKLSPKDSKPSQFEHDYMKPSSVPYSTLQYRDEYTSDQESSLRFVWHHQPPADDSIVKMPQEREHSELSKS